MPLPYRSRLCIVSVGCRFGIWWCSYWSISQSTNLEAGCKDVLHFQHCSAGSPGCVCSHFHWSLSTGETEYSDDNHGIIFNHFVSAVCSLPGMTVLKVLGIIATYQSFRFQVLFRKRCRVRTKWVFHFFIPIVSWYVFAIVVLILLVPVKCLAEDTVKWFKQSL